MICKYLTTHVVSRDLCAIHLHIQPPDVQMLVSVSVRVIAILSHPMVDVYMKGCRRLLTCGVWGVTPSQKEGHIPQTIQWV